MFGDSVSGRLLHHVVEATSEGIKTLVSRTFPLGGDGYSIIAPASGLEPLRGKALEAGAIPATDACLEILRLEAGLPAAGRELTEDYNPWEARLQDAVSLDKGCYVGQEVIARLNTYDKVSKLLVRLRFAGAAVPDPGAPLQFEGHVTGTLTSAATIPGSDQVIALGYVKDEDAIAGREVLAGLGESWIPATIEGVAR